MKYFILLCAITFFSNAFAQDVKGYFTMKSIAISDTHSLRILNKVEDKIVMRAESIRKKKRLDKDIVLYEHWNCESFRDTIKKTEDLPGLEARRRLDI